MPSTFTPNKSIEMPQAGSYNDTWAIPVNADWMDIDNALAGNAQIDATGAAAGVHTLTLAQYQPPNIVFSGAPTGTVVYSLPAGIGWVGSVWNNTSGPYSLSFGSVGNSVVIPQGSRLQFVCDGVNMQVATTPQVSAAPSAKVGLVAVIGSAVTTMASDSAPPLDQAIAPTWTGPHRFNAAVVIANNESLTSSGIFDGTQGQVLVSTQVVGDSALHAASTEFVARSFAPLDSPALINIPTAPTASPGTNTTQLATTAFAIAAALGSGTLATAGTWTMPGGFIIKWGTNNFAAGSGAAISFVSAFPTACFAVVAVRDGAVADAPAYGVNNVTAAGFNGICQAGGGSVFQSMWIAVGH